jgi:hypothetical protein
MAASATTTHHAPLPQMTYLKESRIASRLNGSFATVSSGKQTLILLKRADPKRLKLIADSKPSWRGSRYLSGFILLCVGIGFVGVQAWPRLEPETARTAAIPTSLSVRVIDSDTIGLEDGKP